MNISTKINGEPIICPDGGKTSWYFDSPIDPTYQYETFVAKDCVAYMDKTYRTKANRDSRALCGNSMIKGSGRLNRHYNSKEGR